MKASTVIVSIRKSCIFTFYHVSAGPNRSKWWKNFGPNLPLLFKLHEICSVDFRKIVKIVATRCQILSLTPPQTPLGELTALPQKGNLLLREGRAGERKVRGRERSDRGGRGREGEERREGEEIDASGGGVAFTFFWGGDHRP